MKCCQYLLILTSVNTPAWMHHMDTDKMYREKTRWELECTRCTRMLQAILNKSLKQHNKKQQLYGHLPPISKIIQIKQTRHAGYCWKSKDKIIRDILLWPTSHGHTCVGWPTNEYIQDNALRFFLLLLLVYILTANTLRKGMHPTILLSAMDKLGGRLGFLTLVWQLF